MLNHRKSPKSQRRLHQDTPATNLHENAVPNTSGNILQLQQTIGNRAVMQMMSQDIAQPKAKSSTFNPHTFSIVSGSTIPSIQRMPVRSEVVGVLGNPKKDKKMFGRVVKENSTKYRAVLDALSAFETYTTANFLERSPSALREQMIKINQLLQDIYTKMSAYNGDKGKKAAYILSRLDEVKVFQNIAARAFLDKMDNPDGGHAFLAPSLTSFLNKAQREGGAPPLQLNADDQIGSERGGTKEVSKFEEGYFKGKQDKLQSFDSESNPEQWDETVRALNQEIDQLAIENDWDEEKVQEEKFLRKNALGNEFRLGVQSLGINPEDARMHNRDIALSRLDQLFGTNLIARAQMAVVHLPDGSQIEGQIMENARSDNAFSPKDVLGEGREDTFSNKQELIDYRKDKLGVDDPELMRQLSRLYLLDIIASQIDRNVGNYFIHRDDSGRLLGITGIDNDLSFGTGESADIHKQELRGITRYVDKEMAQMIINLDASILESILSDLLPPNEVQAAIKRLENLQQELSKEETHLLEPDEWLNHRDAILEEGNDYYSSLMNYKIKDARGVKYKK